MDPRYRQLRTMFAAAIADAGAARDECFDDLYVQGLWLTGTKPTPLRRRDRFRRLLQEFERALHLPGLVAECGCFRGLSSFLLCSRLRQHDPSFDGEGYEIYDSFQGLSAPAPEDIVPTKDGAVAESLRTGFFACSLEEVRRALAAFPRINYIAGWIPNFMIADERRYRFVHIDVDLYQPTRDSLKHFWPLVVNGGIMICDDYNWPGARAAVDDFAAAHGLSPSITPTTQAIFTKPLLGP